MTDPRPARWPRLNRFLDRAIPALIVACILLGTVTGLLWLRDRDAALLARADCAVALGGELTEETFRRATRHACQEAGILKP